VEQLLCELAKQFPGVKCLKLDAEASAYAETFDVDVVPTVVLLHSEKNVFAKVEGAEPTKLAAALSEFARSEAPPQESAEAALERRLQQLIASAPAMLFMKGTPAEPKCKFARTVTDLLKSEGIEFASFNILADDAVRQGLKVFSNWPTYPQFYANGALVGGLDILQEMAADGDLKKQLGLTVESLEDRLRALTHKAPAMLFIKGSPGEERCGFSRTIVGLLQSQGVTFETFDILSDDAVREGLKKFSNWPTFPQFYVKGELIGGLDILQGPSMHSSETRAHMRHPRRDDRRRRPQGTARTLRNTRQPAPGIVRATMLLTYPVSE